MTKQASTEKKCWACHKTLIGKGAIGLCSTCTNRYGSPAAAALVIGAGIGGKYLLKNSGRIVMGIARIIKNQKI